jgi:hypothetical protein
MSWGFDRTANSSPLKEIREKQEEEDEAYGEQIHKQAKDYAGVVEVSLRAQAADGFKAAVESEDGRNDQQQRAASAGKSRERKRCGKAAEDEDVTAQKRPAAKVEDSER